MRFWKRKPVEAPEPQAEPEGMVADRLQEDPGEPQNEGVWRGPVSFGADGWFHPHFQDQDGNELHPDLDRKLIHNSKTEEWEFARPEHRDHRSYWELKHPQGAEKVLEPLGEQDQ